MTDEPLTRPTNQPPQIACNLSALSRAQREVRARLAAELRRGVIDVIDLPNGYAVHLDRRSVIASQLHEFIALEQECCSFLTFKVHAGETPDGPVKLEVTGAEGVKQFLVSQFDLMGTG